MDENDVMSLVFKLAPAPSIILDLCKSVITCQRGAFLLTIINVVEANENSQAGAAHSDRSFLSMSDCDIWKNLYISKMLHVLLQIQQTPQGAHNSFMKEPRYVFPVFLC